MKTLWEKITDTLADAALLEMGVEPARAAGRSSRPAPETLEENLTEAAFAEAGDYDEIHEAILRERLDERDIAHPDDCQFGDNDLCFV